jgi:hypothetical protein
MQTGENRFGRDWKEPTAWRRSRGSSNHFALLNHERNKPRVAVRNGEAVS